LTRIIIAAIFGPLIILISYLGGWWLFFLVLLLAGLGMIELMLGSRLGPGQLLFWVTLVFLLGIVAISMQMEIENGLMVLILYLILSGVLIVFRDDKPAKLFFQQTSLFWGVAYLGLLYPFVYHIRYLALGSGGDWLLFLFGSLWLSDTLAMFVGKTIGRKKLAPRISPGKTMAGLAGGFLGGPIVAMILGYWCLSEILLVHLLVAGLLVSLFGQMGDLVESCWKRVAGLKDSSAIIPGHGGVLDRFDSLVFAAPILYWFLKYVIYC
jgi:phosphatidate cytidylyltransferase